MAKKPCKSQDVEVRRGPWTPEENFILISYIAKHGVGCWNHLARASGLKRTGKSCRLRWMNYLRPDIRRGNITLEEELLIMEQHAKWGLPDQDYRILPPPPPAAALPLPSCAAVQAPSMPTSSEFASDSGDLGSGGAGEQLARTLKRPQLVWTPQLHKRFVDVVAHLGIKNAVPQTIMQLMSVDGLTRENVASHLQKYRLYLKRMQCLSGGAGGRSNGGAGSAATTDPACEQMVAAAVGHPDLQAQYHRQLGHFGSSPNGQFEHPLLARQTQQPLHRMGGAPLPKQVPSSHVQDLESANGNGGRKVLTLFPSGDY